MFVYSAVMIYGWELSPLARAFILPVCVRLYNDLWPSEWPMKFKRFSIAVWQIYIYIHVLILNIEDISGIEYTSVFALFTEINCLTWNLSCHVLLKYNGLYNTIHFLKKEIKQLMCSYVKIQTSYHCNDATHDKQA